MTNLAGARDAGGGYRDEDFAAARRIEQLEARLGPHAPPPRKSPARVTIERVLVLSAVAMTGYTAGALATLMHHARRAPAYVVEATKPAPPPPPLPAPMTWYEPSAEMRGPLVAETSDAKLFVGLLWLRDAREGLHVAAFDRATLKPRWIAGPYPSASPEPNDRHALAIAGERVVLTDLAGTVRVLDLGTGEEQGALVLKLATARTCTAKDGAVAVGGAFLLDPVKVTARPANAPCEAPVTPGEPDVPWKGRLRARIPGEPERVRAGDSVYGAHRAVGAGYRLASRAAADAAFRFDVTVPGTNDGSAVGLAATGEAVFVRVDGELLVFDAKNGAFRGRLEGP